MTAMPPLQLQNGQVPADWGRVQVVQQPMQNGYLQPIYGQQVLMPGNIIQQGYGQQQPIQVITGKPFQNGQITPQMLTTAQGKQVIGNGTTSFGGTMCMPTSQGQTLFLGPMNVLSSQPQQQQQQQQSQQQQPQQLLPMGSPANVSVCYIKDYIRPTSIRTASSKTRNFSFHLGKSS